MLFRTILVATAAVAASATKILLPLYQWSGDCWPELQQAATENPALEFILIFNPSSGPITDAADPSLYCIPRLRKLLPTSTFIGYVRTDYGNRAAADVNADIATYKTWSGITVDTAGSTARLDGIFFDEVVSEASSTNLALYSGYSTAVRNAFGAKGMSTIVYNPGTVVDARFYDTADIVVSFETYYKEWQGASSLPVTSLVPKSAIMIHSFPTGTSGSSLLPTAVQQIAPRAGAVFITDIQLAEADVRQQVRYRRQRDDVNAGYHDVDAGYHDVDARRNDVNASYHDLDAGYHDLDARRYVVDASYHGVDAGYRDVDARRNDAVLPANEARRQGVGRVL
ncbi:hypothetical protein JCM3770_002383 [Rhodotorula araucariae]